MKLSAEQEAIVSALKSNNVIVDAVAGSGKTTTALGVAEAYKDKKILMLTYNKALKEETQKKLEKNNVSNAKAYTFHGFAAWFYSHSCKDDSELQEILFSKSEEFRSRKISYDLIIIDEAQDLKLLFLCLIRKIFEQNIQPNFRVLIMGDERQSIYKFMDADPRYLTKFDEFMKDVVPGIWKRLPLKETFRVGKKTASFVNDVFYQENIMTPINDGDDIEYLLVDTKDFSDSEGTWFNHLVNEIKKYGINNTFILAPSIKGKFPLALANKLKEMGFIVENSASDFSSKKDKENKLTFSSFHQSKGLEKDLVVLCNFDSSSVDFYAGSVEEVFDPMQHNPEYVALTRAKKKLIILNSRTAKPLYFLNRDWLKENANTSYVPKFDESRFKRELAHPGEPTLHMNIKSAYSVTDLCDFLKENHIKELKKCYKVVKAEKVEPEELIKLFKKVPYFVDEQDEQGHIYQEDVAAFNGTAVVANYSILREKINPFINGLLMLIGVIKSLDESDYEAVSINPNLYLWADETYFDSKGHKLSATGKWILGKEEWLNGLNSKKGQMSISDLLELVVTYQCAFDGRIFAAQQITSYGWIKDDIFYESNAFLKKYFGKDKLVFEDPISLIYNYYRYGSTEAVPVVIQGFTDCLDITKKELYEFKFMDDISDTQFIQLVGYAFIMYWMSENVKGVKIKKNSFKKMKWYLLNIKTGIKYEVKVKFDKLNTFFDSLISNKVEHKEPVDMKLLLDHAKSEFKKIN